MRANIKLSLYSLLPVAVLALLDNVNRKMTGNATYPTPAVPLADMTAMSTELRTSIEAATGGSLASKKHRDNVVERARRMLRIQADYVRSVADGDAALLASSGYTLAKTRERIIEVMAPKKLQAITTQTSGRVELRWAKVYGAHIYRVEQASSDPAAEGAVTWETLELTTRQRLNVDDLEAYTPNWFRVTAIGVNGEGLPSDVVLGRAA